MTPTSSRRILVIEDDATLNRLLVEQIGRLGHEATGAETRAAALKVLSQQRVDLAILDLRLTLEYLETHGELGDVEVRAAISRAVDASPSLRNKKDLIEAFVDSLTVDADVDGEWKAFVAAKRAEDLDRIITDENLRPEETHEFVARAFRDGAVPTAGTAVTRILPPVSRFAKANNHSAKKQTVLEKLSAFFSRYFGLS